MEVEAHRDAEKEICLCRAEELQAPSGARHHLQSPGSGPAAVHECEEIPAVSMAREDVGRW